MSLAYFTFTLGTCTHVVFCFKKKQKPWVHSPWLFLCEAMATTMAFLLSGGQYDYFS
jgi:hypothetical protein